MDAEDSIFLCECYAALWHSMSSNLKKCSRWPHALEIGGLIPPWLSYHVVVTRQGELDGEWEMTREQIGEKMEKNPPTQKKKYTREIHGAVSE